MSYLSTTPPIQKGWDTFKLYSFLRSINILLASSTDVYCCIKLFLMMCRKTLDKADNCCFSSVVLLCYLLPWSVFLAPKYQVYHIFSSIYFSLSNTNTLFNPLSFSFSFKLDLLTRFYLQKLSYRFQISQLQCYVFIQR